jgi:hypothetical protein
MAFIAGDVASLNVALESRVEGILGERLGQVVRDGPVEVDLPSSTSCMTM